jgi:hypothetical protein
VTLDPTDEVFSLPRTAVADRVGWYAPRLDRWLAKLLACNETLLHYRTPTEPGSSGSPVFEPEDWRVVGLHHRGSATMPRIDGQEGAYQANEGIAILALQKATPHSQPAFPG